MFNKGRHRKMNPKFNPSEYEAVISVGHLTGQLYSVKVVSQQGYEHTTYIIAKDELDAFTKMQAAIEGAKHD